MVSVVLVMHEPLGAAFAQCVRHVLGEPPSSLHIVDIAADADVDQESDHLGQLLVDLTPPGSLILCDLYGATPFNVAQRAIVLARKRGGRACMLSGTNLYMVLKAVTDPSSDPEALRESVRRRVLRGIVGADYKE